MKYAKMGVVVVVVVDVCEHVAELLGVWGRG